MNEQELIAADIEAYDAAWHHHNQLEHREKEERAMHQSSTKALIERLNSALAILDIIDHPEMQSIIDQLLSIRNRLKRKENLLAESLAKARKEGIL
jgi:hypothetical protein